MKSAVRICFDLRALQIGHESRGIGMFIRSVLENLPNQSDIEYIFYAFEKNDPVRALDIAMQAPYHLVQTKTLKKSLDDPRDIMQLARLLFHTYRPLRPMRPDVFVQFDFMLGLPKWKNTKTAIVAFDLIPLIFKDEYMPSAAQAWRKKRSVLQKSRAVVRALYYRGRYVLHYHNFLKADTVISISNATKKSLERLLELDPQKITTIYPAPVFSEDTTHSIRPSRGIDGNQPYIFYIGGTDARKKIQDLISAYERARDTGQNMLLVLAGYEFHEIDKMVNVAVRDAILESKYKDDIVCLGFVSDTEKLWLYQHAQAFVFPTVYEGFGLPLVEAMRSGCPVIAYNNSSVPEVINDCGILVPTGDISALARAIISINNNPRLAKDLARKGRERAKIFSWQSYVTTMQKLLLRP